MVIVALIIPTIVPVASAGLVASTEWDKTIASWTVAAARHLDVVEMSNGDTLLCHGAKSGSGSSWQNNIWRTSNGGATWTQVASYTAGDVSGLMCDIRSDDSVLVMFTGSINNLYTASYNGGFGQKTICSNCAYGGDYTGEMVSTNVHALMYGKFDGQHHWIKSTDNMNTWSDTVFASAGPFSYQNLPPQSASTSTGSHFLFQSGSTLYYGTTTDGNEPAWSAFDTGAPTANSNSHNDFKASGDLLYGCYPANGGNTFFFGNDLSTATKTQILSGQADKCAVYYDGTRYYYADSSGRVGVSTDGINFSFTTGNYAGGGSYDRIAISKTGSNIKMFGAADPSLVSYNLALVPETFEATADISTVFVDINVGYSPTNPIIAAFEEGENVFNVEDELVIYNTNLGINDRMFNCGNSALTRFIENEDYSPGLVTFDNYIVEACMLKGGNDGIGPDGWGLITYDAALNFITEYWSEFSDEPLVIDGRTADKVFTLLDNSRLALVNTFSHTLTFERGVAGFNKDLSVSKGNDKYAALVGTGGLVLYDFSGNVIATKTGYPGDSVAVYDNHIYVHNAGTITHLNKAGNVITQVGTFARAVDIRGLDISKDGEYLLTEDDSKIRVYNSTRALILESAAYADIFGLDMDITNENIYASIWTGSVNKIVKIPLGDLTTAYGNEDNTLPPTVPSGGETTNPEEGPVVLPPPSGGFVQDPDNWFGIDLNKMSENLSIEKTALKWLIGIFLTLMLMFLVYEKTKSGAIAGLFGGFIGIGASVAFGFIPIWFILMVSLLIIAVAGKVMFGGGSREE